MIKLISPAEYASKKSKSLSTTYRKMQEGVLPWQWEVKMVKRIAWDDETQEAVNISGEGGTVRGRAQDDQVETEVPSSA